MNAGLDLPSLIAEERARERVRGEAHAREAQRCRGVSWSGLAPDAWRPRTDAQLEAAAQARLASLQAWRRSRPGRFLAAVANAQRAAERAHLAGETARAAVARGLSDTAAPGLAAAEALEAEGRAMLAAARAARHALAGVWLSDAGAKAEQLAGAAVQQGHDAREATP